MFLDFSSRNNLDFLSHGKYGFIIFDLIRRQWIIFQANGSINISGIQKSGDK